MFRAINKSLKEHPIFLIAVLMTVIVYSNFLFYGHISWDDPEMVFKNKYVKEFDLTALFTHHFVGNYIPVTMVFHSLAWFLFDANDWGHHVLNILLHIINGLLVYKIGKRLFKEELIANFGAILFLLHPLQIESVGWISELKNVLSATFYLSAVLSYIQFQETSSLRLYWLTFLFFILGCLSKSSVVVLPLSLICIDIINQKGFSLKSILNKTPFLMLSLVFGIINIKTQTADLFINYGHEFPYFQRFGFAGFALLNYLLLFLLPVNLSIIYPYPEIKTGVFVIGYLMLASLLSLLIYFIKQKKYQWFSIVVFVMVNLVLVLQVLPFGEVLFADRYAYIPIIGLAWMLGFIFTKVKTQSLAICLIVIGVFSAFSFSRASAWKSAITLYEDILKKYPEQYVALNSAGVECMFLNEDEKALEYFNKAVRIAPRNYKGFYNRGLLYLKNNKPELALKSFNQTLALYQYGKAYTARASAYYALGDIPKALNDANYAIGMDKNNAKAHFVLGNCLSDLNKLDDAISEYNTCITLNKEESDFYFKRAITYGKKQNFNFCLSDLVVCLALNPNYYEAYYWKGVVKINLKQNPCEDFKIAAEHNYEPAVNAFNKYCR